MAGIPVTFVGEMYYSGLGVGGGPMPGGPPLGIWGGAPLPWPTPPIYYPPPGAGGPPPQPTHPIYYPPTPTHPIALPPGGPPPHPEHPIYFPPPGSPPPLGIWGPPQMPPGYWGGGMGPGVKPQPHPEHPIVLPPDLPPTTPPPDEVPIDWKIAWTPMTGWIVVGVPSGAHPAPSSST